jgi:hypothetical protein
MPKPVRMSKITVRSSLSLIARTAGWRAHLVDDRINLACQAYLTESK